MKTVKTELTARTIQADLTSGQETLTDVIESLFAVRGSGFGAVFKVVLGILSLGWIADSIFPFLQAGSYYLWTKSLPSEFNSAEKLYTMTIPVVWFFCYVGVLFAIRQQKINVLNYPIQGSYPRRGLIISLSPFNEKQTTAAELEKQIDDKTLDIEQLFNHTNWGQLAFTIAHHAPLLQKCWVFSTSKSSEQFPVAEKLINYVSQQFEGRTINCSEIKLEDENNISEMATKVNELYHDLGNTESPLHARDVISNYTGGTSAMTGGMIMATLNENREIEYLNQKYFGKLSKKLLRNIDENLAIVTSKTNTIAAEKLNK